MLRLHPDTLAFLRDLSAHNDRDWFNANKTRYEEVFDAFGTFVEVLTHRIAEFDPTIHGLTAKDSLMRIYRDVRFSKEKTPYQTHLGAHIVAGGRKQQEHSRAGYFIRLEPEKSILAGGAYLPPGPWAQSIRTRIADEPEAFRAIVEHPSFTKTFGKITGDRMKTAPRGFSKDHPAIELLTYKSYLAVYDASDRDVLSAGFLDKAVTVFEAMYPFGRFLNGE
jgi:uncharacterized protein (TIGR02453 family)